VVFARRVRLLNYWVRDGRQGLHKVGEFKTKAGRVEAGSSARHGRKANPEPPPTANARLPSSD